MAEDGLDRDQVALAGGESVGADEDGDVFGFEISEEKSVIAEAKAKSAGNPTLLAFLPAQHKTELTNAIVALEASRTTLQKKGSPRRRAGAF